MMRKLQDSELERLAAGLAAGLSCRQMAALLGVSAATAIRWTQRLGLQSQRARKLSPEARDAVRQALAAGASPTQAAARFDVSPRTAARLADPARAERRRRRLIKDLAEGASLGEAAAEAGVSASTAGRWARAAGLARRRRRATRPDEAQALAAMERGMGAAEAARRFALSEPALARLLLRPRLKPERLARRRQLFGAIASGLSCRKAAALVGLPVATAIRWARQRDGEGR
jgi:transposase